MSTYNCNCLSYEELRGRIYESDGAILMSLETEKSAESVTLILNPIQTKILAEGLNNVAFQAAVNMKNENRLYGGLVIDFPVEVVNAKQKLEKFEAAEQIKEKPVA